MKEKTKLEFAHNIGDTVIIKDIEMQGRVDAVMQDVSGQRFQIIYWWNGSRNSVWMNEWEIDAK